MAIYMPMVCELPMAMLACVRIGAVHSVVFAGFSSDSLAARIESAKSKVTAHCLCGKLAVLAFCLGTPCALSCVLGSQQTVWLCAAEASLSGVTAHCNLGTGQCTHGVCLSDSFQERQIQAGSCRFFLGSLT